jgi:hypothetical protein
MRVYKYIRDIRIDTIWPVLGYLVLVYFLKGRNFDCARCYYVRRGSFPNEKTALAFKAKLTQFEPLKEKFDTLRKSFKHSAGGGHRHEKVDVSLFCTKTEEDYVDFQAHLTWTPLIDYMAEMKPGNKFKTDAQRMAWCKKKNVSIIVDKATMEPGVARDERPESERRKKNIIVGKKMSASKVKMQQVEDKNEMEAVFEKSSSHLAITGTVDADLSVSDDDSVSGVKSSDSEEGFCLSVADAKTPKKRMTKKSEPPRTTPQKKASVAQSVADSAASSDAGEDDSGRSGPGVAAFRAETGPVAAAASAQTALICVDQPTSTRLPDLAQFTFAKAWAESRKTKTAKTYAKDILVAIDASIAANGGCQRALAARVALDVFALSAVTSSSVESLLSDGNLSDLFACIDEETAKSFLGVCAEKASASDEATKLLFQTISATAKPFETLATRFGDNWVDACQVAIVQTWLGSRRRALPDSAASLFFAGFPPTQPSGYGQKASQDMAYCYLLAQPVAGPKMKRACAEAVAGLTTKPSVRFRSPLIV